MSEAPYMPLFVDAYLADTMHLDATESGAYLHLLMAAWRTGECRLPDDDKRLARFARCTPRQWIRIKPAVMAFWTLDGAFWKQKRLSKEWLYVTKSACVSRSNGTRGGRPKSLKTNDTENPAGSSQVPSRLPSGFQNGNPERTQTITTHTHTQYTEPKDGSVHALSAHEALTKTVWENCPPKLENLGISARNARSNVGKWLRDHPPDAVLRAVDKAVRNETPEPVAYVNGALRANGSEPPWKRREDADLQKFRENLDAKRRQEGLA